MELKFVLAIAMLLSAVVIGAIGYLLYIYKKNKPTPLAQALMSEEFDDPMEFVHRVFANANVKMENVKMYLMGINTHLPSFLNKLSKVVNLKLIRYSKSSKGKLYATYEASLNGEAMYFVIWVRFIPIEELQPIHPQNIANVEIGIENSFLFSSFMGKEKQTNFVPIIQELHMVYAKETQLKAEFIHEAAKAYEIRMLPKKGECKIERITLRNPLKIVTEFLEMPYIWTTELLANSYVEHTFHLKNKKVALSMDKAADLILNLLMEGFHIPITSNSPGTGKSGLIFYLMQELAKREVRVILVDNLSVNNVDLLSDVMATLKPDQKAVIVLDDVYDLVKEQNGYFQSLLSGPGSRRNVSFLVSSNLQLPNWAEPLTRPGRFSHEVSLRPLSLEQIKILGEILKTIYEKDAQKGFDVIEFNAFVQEDSKKEYKLVDVWKFVKPLKNLTMFEKENYKEVYIEAQEEREQRELEKFLQNQPKPNIDISLTRVEKIKKEQEQIKKRRNTLLEKLKQESGNL